MGDVSDADSGNVSGVEDKLPGDIDCSDGDEIGNQGAKGADKDDSSDSKSEETTPGAKKKKKKTKGKKRGRKPGQKNRANSFGVEIDEKDRDPLGGGSAKVKRQRNKVVNGKKYCRPCGKWEPVEWFPEGSGQCVTSRKIIQNLGKAAYAQGLWNWFVEKQNSDEQALQKLVRNYKVRLAATGTAMKMGSYPIAQYYEEVRRERLVMVKHSRLAIRLARR